MFFFYELLLLLAVCFFSKKCFFLYFIPLCSMHFSMCIWNVRYKAHTSCFVLSSVVAVVLFMIMSEWAVNACTSKYKMQQTHKTYRNAVLLHSTAPHLLHIHVECSSHTHSYIQYIYLFVHLTKCLVENCWKSTHWKKLKIIQFIC